MAIRRETNNFTPTSLSQSPPLTHPPAILKIGLVRRGYSPTGGAENYLIRFAEGLEAKGHSCLLFSDREWPESAWGDRPSRVIGRTGKSPGDFADALEQSRPKDYCDFLFSLERVWNCSCFRAGDGVHAAWLKRRAKFEPGWRTAFRRFNGKHQEILALEHALYRPDSPAHIIANASFVKQEIQDTYETPADRITVIPNGFDPPALDAEERKDLREKGRAAFQIEDDTVAFLFVGSGWERKGLRFAIDAIESLADQGKNVRLLVAGNDKRKPKTRHQGIVWILGPANPEQITRLYESADVFLLPTLYDPFSNACLEAACHGLPVITTTANGFCELWPDIEGSVIDSPDSADLPDLCEEWLDPKRRAAARTANRAAAAFHTVERNVSRTLACFQELIDSSES